MRKEFIEEITKQINEFESMYSNAHGVETIITGVDPDGAAAMPHICQVVRSSNGNSITCCDSVGFAAVGSGARHAESQFMLAGHSRYSPMPETLLLTYLAKKRSEVAPGVGKGTDMFTIGPNLGSFLILRSIQDFDMRKIESIYESVEDGQGKVFKKAKTQTKTYIEKMFKRRASQQQLNPPPPTASP